MQVCIFYGPYYPMWVRITPILEKVPAFVKGNIQISTQMGAGKPLLYNYTCIAPV